ETSRTTRSRIGPSAELSNWTSPPAKPKVSKNDDEPAWMHSALRTGAPFLSQHSSRGGFVAKLLVGFLDADRRAGAGSKTAVRIQRDALRGEMLRGLAHPGGDDFRRVDFPRRHIDAAQTDLKILAQFPQHGAIAG